VTANGSEARRRASASAAEDDDSEFVAQFGLSLLRAGRMLRHLRHPEVSPTQVTALSMIDKYGPLPISELAAMEGVSRPTASVLVNRLEDLGYVRRHDDPDGRVCPITLTRRGRSRLATTRRLRTEWLKEHLADCTPAEIQSLHVALEILDRVTAAEMPSGSGRSASRSRPTDAVSSSSTRVRSA
jgi:DNA-binding MarR family transcriptional regulator